jgi:hypothetical protein
MTGTSQDEWIKESFAEADEMTKKELEANANVAGIIASGEKAVSKITVNGVEIRHKSFIARPLRRQLLKLSQNTEDTDNEAVENVMYKTLASLCLDAPFNTPQAWSYIEEKGGDAAAILAAIMANINKSQEELKTFRGKR